MIVPYRRIPAAERLRTLDYEDVLYEAACTARDEGWHSHERDVIASEARRLDLKVWPALINRLTREARASHFY